MISVKDMSIAGDILHKGFLQRDLPELAIIAQALVMYASRPSLNPEEMTAVKEKVAKSSTVKDRKEKAKEKPVPKE